MNALKNTAIAITVLLLLATGSLLLFTPSHYLVSRSTQIQATPEQLLPLIDDLQQWPQWAPWFQRDPAMKLSYSGARRGVGARSSWESISQGRGSMEIKSSSGIGIHYRLDFPDSDSHPNGTLLLQAHERGTTVTWQMQEEVGANPLKRLFGLFMDNIIGGDFEAGLQGLKQLAEKH